MQQLKHEEPAILTDLCTICHVNAIKYTCPRCSVHTCSLPCVKKHKQWAQCTGVRDPAEYRKRGDLATPASIDKDFNFITGLERSLQRADNNVVDRGIDLAPARPMTPHLLNKSKVDLEAEARNLTIIRAPKGLSRSKLNRTHWHGATKCILWTVEWLDAQNNKRINNVHEIKTIREAYIGTFGKKAVLKRKRLANDVDGHEILSGHCAANSAHSSNISEQRPGDRAGSPEGIAPSKTIGGRDKPGRLNAQEVAESKIEQPLQVLPEKHTDQPSKLQQPRVVETADKDSSATIDELFFYLLRPNTEARYRVLIPLSPDQFLKDALVDKTILEFPTIFVLHVPPTHLEKPFLSDKDYRERYGNDIPINITTTPLGGITDAELEEGEIVNAGLDLPPGFDESKVLEVIEKDLGS